MPYIEARKVNTRGVGLGDERVRWEVDKPLPAVMAHGIGGVAWHQYELVLDNRKVTMAESTKPPYAIPLMTEINAVPRNGFSVISLFAGGGGSSLGYRMAGYRVRMASEFIPAAAETYRANAAPETIVDGRDIRQLTTEDVMAATGLERGELDLLDGSPPCASFSTAGSRAGGWGRVKPYSDTKQRTDDLFGEYLRLVDGLRPKVAVAENVPGLSIGFAIGFYNDVILDFKAFGYVVEAAILEAEWLGVPQARHRLFFVAVREDLAKAGLKPAFPDPLPYYYSIADACPWILSTHVASTPSANLANLGKRPGHNENEPSPTVTTSGLHVINGALERTRVTARTASGFQREERDVNLPDPTLLTTETSAFLIERTRLIQQQGGGFSGNPTEDGLKPWEKEIDGDRPLPTLPGSQGAPFVVETETSLDGFAIGEQWDRMGGASSRPAEHAATGKKVEGESKYFQLVRPNPDEPCPTVTATAAQPGAASVVHPTERRKFSVGELKRLCGFPDDYVMTGTYAQQVERLGRAVMPPVTRALGQVIAEKILAPWRDRVRDSR